MTFEDGEGLISLDINQATFVTSGVVGTGEWNRGPCQNPECEDEICKQGGTFRIISLIMTDVDGNEITIVIPEKTQFAEILTDHDTISFIQNGLGV